MVLFLWTGRPGCRVRTGERGCSILRQGYKVTMGTLGNSGVGLNRVGRSGHLESHPKNKKEKKERKENP